MCFTTLLISITFLTGVFQLCAFPQESVRIDPDLEIIRISPNAYVHVSYASLPDYGRTAANGLIFIKGNEAFIFDTPWNDTLTRKLVTYLGEKMKLQIKGFVPNHWHEDCMGGLNYIRYAGIRSYANQLTIEIAKNKGLPLPDIGFTDSLQLNLGDKSIHCYFPGAAHSKDNIVVWIPSEKILFPGCICKSMNSTNIGNVADGDITEYPKTIDFIVRKFDPLIVIPGHGPAGGPELLIHTRSLIPKQ